MIVSLGLSTGSGGVVNNQSGECACLTVANPGEQVERIYTYDNNRNLIDIHAPDVPWYNQTFTYDALNRLTDATGRYGTIGYTYDNVGNRVTRTVNGQIENYNYIAGTNKLNQITGANPISFTYDENGNTTAMGSKILVYNQNNRLIRVEENSVVLGEYTYNGLGQRVIKTVDGITTIFHYDLNGKLIAESLPDGPMTAEYLYIGKIRIAKVDATTGNIYYYLNDRLGTPQLMTDDGGTIVWEASYKPFGEATVNPKSTVVNNFRFPGQYYDQETGLHYNYHRYYDPQIGRYLTPDPIGLRGGINIYVYALNNPINEIDPFGWQTQWPVKGTPEITSPFGPREAPVPGASEFHEGIDLKLPLGEAAVASDSGFVYQAGPAIGGNRVIVHHDDGSWSWYRHITPTVVRGQRVEAGQEVGLSDGSGIGTAPHLHYEYATQQGEKIDPLKHLPRIDCE